MIAHRMPGRSQNELASFFSDISEIELVYQFGSSVKEGGAAPADIDIALLLREPIPADRRFEIQMLLEERLSKVFKKRADIAILNQASPFFAHQVLSKGHLLYGERIRARDYIVETLTRYFDYLPLHQFFVQKLEGRLGVRSRG